VWETYPSWLTLNDITNRDWRRQNGEHNQEWLALIARLERYAGLFGGSDNVRLVYWFET
jgi:hypothetical protein